MEHLFIVLTIFVITTAPLYLKNWYTQATVFLFNNLQPNCSVQYLPDISFTVMLPPLPNPEIFKISVKTNGIFQETAFLPTSRKIRALLQMFHGKLQTFFCILVTVFIICFIVKPTTASAMVAIKILGLFGHIHSPFLTFPLAHLSNSWTPHHRDWAQFK